MKEIDFHDQAQIFLADLFKDMAYADVKLESHWDIDHLCYRSDSTDHYKRLKNEFISFASLLIESEVNGRLISTYKLNKAVKFHSWRIDLVELPAPKLGKVTKAGFEHIEIVCDVPFVELIEKYSHLQLDQKGMSKDYNQELEICLGERNLKFHHSSLASVINLEMNTAVYSAIAKSKILHHFKEYNPLIAGTFPLAINVEGSDVDVLLEVLDFEVLSESLKAHYGHCAGFEITFAEVDSLQTLICHFTFDQVPFEVFAQYKSPVRQTAYRHFLIEERLLKLHGELFREQVLKTRMNGLKTEPAFAEVLKLKGDPYQALLDLQKKSSLV